MTVPESPRWLVKCGIINKARDILIQIGEPDVEKELAAIQKSLKTIGGNSGGLFRKNI